MNIVWSIAGSDSGSGAGIQADLLTFHDYQVHGCTAITALTAQNTQGVANIQAATLENLRAQLIALKQDLYPKAIKLGMLYTPELIKCIAEQLSDMNVSIIGDPVLVSTSQDKLYCDDFVTAYQEHIFPLVTLNTPNIHEAQIFTGLNIQTHDDMEKAAVILLSMGAKSVLIKGGDFDHPELSSDYYADGCQKFWINLPRLPTRHTHGTGCTLSAAIAAGIAQDWSLLDAIVLAKAYVHAGLSKPVTVGHGRQPVSHHGLSDLHHHFPWITDSPAPLPEPFKKITKPIGRYPLVDNVDDLKALCSKGISFIQLRVKHPGPDFESLCREALIIAQSYGVTLIINDHVDKNVATGVHLGQEDILDAQLSDINRSKILLGISAHNLYELSRAYAYHPSYLAIGPIFETQSKKLDYPPIGLSKLKLIADLSPLPLVAIGGIDYQDIPKVLELGCSGVAFIGAAKQLIQDGRYDRHFALPGFTRAKQQQLAQAKIVCVGTGGLAAGFLPYLAAAGVGFITLIDHDVVSYSNLQRQILFQECDVGKHKVDAAARYLKNLNTGISLNIHPEKLTIDNAINLLSTYDLILDGTDNFDTHYLINDTARHLNTDLIAASVFRDQGQLFFICAQSGCYRCLFPVQPGMHELNCDTAGVLGTTPGLLGIMQAQLAIECLTEPNKYTQSFCRTVNTQTWQIKSLQITPSQDCITCHTSLSSHDLRSLHMQTSVEQITAEALKESLDAGHPINLLDVREDNEREEYNIGGVHIPIQELPERIYEIDPTLPYVVYCHAGGRSTMACQFLIGQGFKVKNLTGGMIAWRAL